MQLLIWRALRIMDSKCTSELALDTSFRHEINSKAGAIHDALHLPAVLGDTIIKPDILIKTRKLVVTGESLINPCQRPWELEKAQRSPAAGNLADSCNGGDVLLEPKLVKLCQGGPGDGIGWGVGDSGKRVSFELQKCSGRWVELPEVGEH